MNSLDFQRELQKQIRDVNVSMCQLMNQYLVELNLSGSQAGILMQLHRNRRMMVSALSEKLRMPPSNISAICGRLERNRLITRSRDEQDQRIVFIELTEYGCRIASQLQADMLRQHESFAQIATQEDQEIILEGLNRLNQILYRLSESKAQNDREGE